MEETYIKLFCGIFQSLFRFHGSLKARSSNGSLLRLVGPAFPPHVLLQVLLSSFKFLNSEKC